MEAWRGKSPWQSRQARWSVPDMERAIEAQCRICNDDPPRMIWHEGTDCVSPDCPLFPYRPGEQRPEVNGVRRAVRHSRTDSQKIAAKESMKKLRASRDATGNERPISSRNPK